MPVLPLKTGFYPVFRFHKKSRSHPYAHHTRDDRLAVWHLRHFSIPARVLQLEHPLRGAQMIVVELIGRGVEHAEVLRELRVV